MTYALLGIPTATGLAAFLLPANASRRILLLLSAAAHSALTAWCWVHPPPADDAGWIHADGVGLVFLSAVSFVFLLVSVYTVGYLARQGGAQHPDFGKPGLFFTNAPEAGFVGCLLMFLAAMTLVCLSRHLLLVWVAIEATTLASAPLIYFHRKEASLEATWKYILLCSVGIALALLGNFLLVASVADAEGRHPLMTIERLLQSDVRFEPALVKAAFLLLVVGYGTKMGLAPLHNWKPDAYSESPSPAGALLAGALATCAFLSIVRVQQVVVAAGLADFAGDVLIGFGLFSMAVAAAFVIRQGDFKRMLAYSSVEHMGVLAVGLGAGGAGVYASLLHGVHHGLIKSMLFLVAGNISAVCLTKNTADVVGLSRRMPLSAVLWVAGFLAITGAPPFGTFFTELTVLKSLLDSGRSAAAAAYLALLALVFVGFAGAVPGMVQGDGSSVDRPAPEPAVEPLWSVVPPALLLSASPVLGLYVPPMLDAALRETARTLGGL